MSRKISSAFLITFANEALSFLKKRKRKYLFTTIDYNSKLSKNLEDDNYYNGDEIQLRLQKALLTLPDKQRLVFNMKYFDHMKTLKNK